MTITEPMTFATDCLLAALVFWFALRLLHVGDARRQRAVLLWSAAFFASSAAAASGAVVHGLALYLGDALRAGLWKVTVYSVGLASFFLVASASCVAARGKVLLLLLAAAGTKFALYAWWMADHDDFRYVIYDYAPALLLVLVLMVALWALERRPGTPWAAAGILVSFAAAGVQQSGFDLHRHFNHNDLYHVVQMGAFWLLYRGGLLLRDR